MRRAGRGLDPFPVPKRVEGLGERRDYAEEVASRCASSSVESGCHLSWSLVASAMGRREDGGAGCREADRVRHGTFLDRRAPVRVRAHIGRGRPSMLRLPYRRLVWDR